MFPIWILLEQRGRGVMFSKSINGVGKSVEIEQVASHRPESVHRPFHILKCKGPTCILKAGICHTSLAVLMGYRGGKLGVLPVRCGLVFPLFGFRGTHLFGSARSAWNLDCSLVGVAEHGYVGSVLYIVLAAPLDACAVVVVSEQLAERLEIVVTDTRGIGTKARDQSRQTGQQVIVIPAQEGIG